MVKVKVLWRKEIMKLGKNIGFDYAVKMVECIWQD